jgi:UDP-3-O-acyl-N-acetylglucosamine deacetylase
MGTAGPYHGYKLSFEIDFSHPAVDSTGQRVVFDMSATPIPKTSPGRAPLASPKTWK